MKNKGRICAISFIISSWLIWNLIHGIYIKFMDIIVLMFLGMIGWILGKQYDIAKFHSEIDPLTKIYNRRFVLNVYPKLAAKAQRQNKKLVLLMIDCDRFKTINDTYGHEMGDRVLRKIANVLYNDCAKKIVAARWGGDEFVVILDDNQPDLDSLIHCLEHKLSDLSRNLAIDISVCVGQSCYPDDGEKLTDLIKVADQKMYQLKNGKKENAG